MNTKQIYIRQIDDFFQIDLEEFNHRTINEIVHYGLEKFLNQKANSLARKKKHPSREKKHQLREEICEEILNTIYAIEQEYITIPHTKTLEEKSPINSF